MSRTIQQLAQEALDVQNASNLCGVAQSFARAMVDLRAHDAGPLGDHAITHAWLSKLVSLTGQGRVDATSVFDAVESLAGRGDV